MGHWGLGIGEEEDKEEAAEQRGRGDELITNAPCPMPYAQFTQPSCP